MKFYYSILDRTNSAPRVNRKKGAMCAMKRLAHQQYPPPLAIAAAAAAAAAAACVHVAEAPQSGAISIGPYF